MASIHLLEAQVLLDMGGIFVYSAACSIFLPFPSEAPMFLFPELSRITVLILCSLGKGSGAYIAFISGDWLSKSDFFANLIRLLRIEHLQIKLLNWSQRFM